MLLPSGRTCCSGHGLPSSLLDHTVHPQLAQFPRKVTKESSFLLLSSILVTYL